MNFQFDLISDLHISTWDKDLDWTGQPTSPHCVIAGDVDRDIDAVARTLEHLGKQYKGGVFYIDGNDEHRHTLDDLSQSYRDLNKAVSNIKNVIYLQDNVVVINGVGILATNGWWTYDFNPEIDYDQTIEWYKERYQLSLGQAAAIADTAYHDTAYMVNSVNKLQRHKDVRAIVMVSHTVPAPWIIDHDIELADSYRYNGMGNKHMRLAIEEDTEHKIKAWCFGHYHKSVDIEHEGIRYVNNCRGRGDTDWAQHAYYPKRITIET